MIGFLSPGTLYNYNIKPKARVRSCCMDFTKSAYRFFQNTLEFLVCGYPSVKVNRSNIESVTGLPRRFTTVWLLGQTLQFFKRYAATVLQGINIGFIFRPKISASGGLETCVPELECSTCALSAFASQRFCLGFPSPKKR